MSQFSTSADRLLTDDRAAQAYVAKRQRDLPALQVDLADPNNGYASLSRTDSGVQIQTKTATLLAVSFVAAQAFVLAKFW